MSQIRIQFTRFSAFYSPLIATISGGFLKDEGLDPVHSIAPAGVSAISALIDGSAEVVQSALSQGFTALEKGEDQPVVHFAQINEMDGFFLASRSSEVDFDWNMLSGKEVLVADDNDPENNHKSTTLALMGDWTVREYDMATLKDKKMIAVEEEVLLVGPESPVEELQKLSLD